MKVSRLTAALVAVIPSIAGAQIYSGVDYATGLHGYRGNSDATRLLFTTNTGAGLVTNLEGAGLNAFNLGGGITASLSGSQASVTNFQTANTGYNTTAGGNYFYQFTTSSFGGSGTLTLNFDHAVNSFGAYFTGVEWGFGLTLADADGFSYTLPSSGDGDVVNHCNCAAPAGIQFFGVHSNTAFSSVTFTLTDQPNGRDIFGIDDIYLGNNVNVTPEPASLALVGTGLVGVAAFVRRRRMSRG